MCLVFTLISKVGGRLGLLNVPSTSSLTGEQRFHLLSFWLMQNWERKKSVQVPIKSLLCPRGVKGKLTRAVSGQHQPLLLLRMARSRLPKFSLFIDPTPPPFQSTCSECWHPITPRKRWKRREQTPLRLLRQHYAVFISLEKWELNFWSPE